MTGFPLWINERIEPVPPRVLTPERSEGSWFVPSISVYVKYL